MKNDVETWLEFAERDLGAARAMLHSRIYTHACFEAQQVIEKALKALLLRQGKRIPKIHDLLDLLSLTEEPALASFTADLTLINSYYLPVRYPDTLNGGPQVFDPTPADAKAAVDSAEVLFKRIEEIVRPD